MEKAVVEVVRALCYVYDSNPALNYTLSVGLKGVVCEIDDGGDVLVDFEGVGRKWLLQEDLANISIIPDAKADVQSPQPPPPGEFAASQMRQEAVKEEEPEASEMRTNAA